MADQDHLARSLAQIRARLNLAGLTTFVRRLVERACREQPRRQLVHA